jgi:hypothetical protein
VVHVSGVGARCAVFFAFFSVFFMFSLAFFAFFLTLPCWGGTGRSRIMIYDNRIYVNLRLASSRVLVNGEIRNCLDSIGRGR